VVPCPGRTTIDSNEGIVERQGSDPLGELCGERDRNRSTEERAEDRGTVGAGCVQYRDRVRDTRLKSQIVDPTAVGQTTSSTVEQDQSAERSQPIQETSNHRRVPQDLYV